MSLSEDYLRQRRRRFWRKIALSSGVIALIAATLFAFILSAKGIAVEVAPPAAAAIAERELSGGGFVIADKVYLLTRRATLTVAAVGFVPRTIELDRGLGKHNIAVTLEEAPALLRASAAPADGTALADDDTAANVTTQWTLDDRFAGMGMALTVALEPGAHTLTAAHPYHRPQTVSFDIERGAERTIALVFAPLAGELDISSEPPGATVTLDGEPVGVTPVSLSRPGGRYRLEINAGDFTPIDDEIEITVEQSHVQRNYRLAHKKANVTLSLSPPGGELRVDGKLTPTSSPLAVEPLREVAISYSKPGHASRTIKKTLQPGEATQAVFSLAPDSGKVVIDAEPAAQISLNGKAAGVTPQTFNLRTVTHTVTLSKQGYRSATVRFKPTGTRTTTIRETLRNELASRLAESPRRKVNTIGVELILFDPRRAKMPFVIGAGRGEKGQRANEFLRNVRLTRPFYAASKEISVAQYARFRAASPANKNLPMTNITWHEAAEFCNWLSAGEKLTPFYAISGGRVTGFDADADGYRLLSEAEWEWLARYADRPQSARFVWGDATTIPDKAVNIADESLKRGGKGSARFYVPGYDDGYANAAPVGSLAADAAGLYDMGGNVSEWMHDVYTLQQPGDGELTDPLGLPTGAEHVVKGASWRSGTLSSLRSSFREGLGGKRDDLGFRIARYISATSSR